MKIRCQCAGKDQLLIKYPDKKWEVPVLDTKYFLIFRFWKVHRQVLAGKLCGPQDILSVYAGYYW